MKKIKTTLNFLLLTLSVATIIFWGISIVKCEYQTAKYGFQFKESYREHTMITHPDYLKLLEYDDCKAVVYYVKKGEGGNILLFQRENATSDWSFTYWKTIWSRTGSASGFVWPYIR